MTPELLELHKANGYCVRVQKLKSGIGCFAEFPKVFDKKPFVVAYVVDENELKVIIEKEGEKGDLKKLPIKKFAMRAIIGLDIISLAKKYNINAHLVLSPSAIQLMDYELDPQEAVKEKTLYNFIEEKLFGKKMPDAKTDVDEESKALCDEIIKNGGICNA